MENSVPTSTKKRSNKKNKKADEVARNNTETASSPTTSGEVIEDIDNKSDLSGACNNISLKDIRLVMDVLNYQRKPAKTPEEAKHKEYQFWSTQPVPKMDENISTEFGPILPPVTDMSTIRTEAYTLPPGFQWDTLQLDDPLQLNELYTLLNENYVEDDDSMFRFDYPPTFLKWALQPPGWLKDWHCGVRVEKSKRLVGFISAIPATLRVYDHVQKMVEINFLCVHKKLRSKRVAPVLIREITRRVNLKGIFQAVYTAGVVLPKPIGTCRYWHRSLNPKKLIDVKFSHLSRNMTLQRTMKLYKLPENVCTKGFRKLTVKDIPQAHKLLEEYLKKFDLAPVFSEEEFRHWFTPQDGIVDSFVVVHDTNSKDAKPTKSKKLVNGDHQNEIVTDFVSYYTLPSTIMHHPVHKTLKAAYSFYNVSTQTQWVDLMNDALISAKNLNFDVFNALDLMDNREFLEPLKFGIGDGNLQYYLYNWRCPPMNTQKIGLILITIVLQ
ncbi:glycylpeptide N-tetradecanoyltransferase [Chrysoperla carnea]|uniref:glycylpeptide N-tetradecanoyltransferase n=1 Tax=Chrysoperla carnea TaxID=189513 RepID=UPI001D0996F3|nr:glycylpeptide N-tetradecanoyltransferase [Chrysoperla carnea]